MAKKPAATGGGKTPNKPASRAVATKPKNDVAHAEGDLLKMMQGDAGKGVSTAMDDNVVPLIYILQPLSPQVIKKDPKYVQGAEAGQIWFRGTKKVLDGEEGMLAQPVHFSKCVIEWRPDRGGFVARYQVDAPNEIPGAHQVKDPKDPKKVRWVSKDGNDLVSTREHVVLVHGVFDKPMPFVIPMSGSQHTSSRNWMTLMTQKEVEGSDDPAPSFAYLYKLCIEPRSDGKNNWFGWDIADAGEDGEKMLITEIDEGEEYGMSAYKLARKISNDFARGTLRADAPEQEGEHISDEV